MADLAVIGTGLIGTSIGLAATAAGFDVLLVDADPEHVAAAASLGAGVPGGAVENLGTSAPLAVVAVPPSAAAGVIGQCLQAMPEATVTDVASVKGPVIEALRAAHADLSRYVGGHPMAGRESSGPAAANPELFRGRSWLLTPTAETEPQRLAQVARFAEATGAVARTVDPASHDRAVALTSHAPQVVSSLMAARLAAADPGLVEFSGQGLRDVVRIARSDASLWSDILRTNAQEVAPILAGLAADLAAVQEAIGGDDGQAIVEVIRSGNVGSGRLPAKHGGAATVYVDVPVEVPDSPGALGRLFLAAGEAGINLEDVSIEHTIGRLTAIAHLQVLPATGDALRGALLADGWLVLE